MKWQVWGDRDTLVTTNLTEAQMKKMVDSETGKSFNYYGEDEDGNLYEGNE